MSDEVEEAALLSRILALVANGAISKPQAIEMLEVSQMPRDTQVLARLARAETAARRK